MATDRQRQANRLNALKSAGPKSTRGKKQASQNAQKHGLSTPLPLHLIEGEQERIAASVMLDGVDPLTAQELAVRIVEFERNMAYQRTLFSEESLGPKSYLGALADQYAENVQLIESTLADCSATFLESFRAIDKSFRPLGRSCQRSAALFSGIEANRRKNSLRYMKRSLNQLIKLLKRSASGS